MPIFNKAFEVGNALSIDNSSGIFTGSATPEVQDDGSLPVGTLYLRTTGELYQKIQQPDVYKQIISALDLDSLISFASVTEDYVVLDDVDYVFVTASTATITITLPTPSFYTGRVITIKKVSGANLVKIVTNDLSLLDGYSELAIKVSGNSLSFVSDGTLWSTV